MAILFPPDKYRQHFMQPLTVRYRAWPRREAPIMDITLNVNNVMYARGCFDYAASCAPIKIVLQVRLAFAALSWA